MGSLAVRRRLFREQNGKCHYCNIQMHMQEMRKGHPASLTSCTVDHIIPQSEGGGNAKRNLVGACFLCNNARGVIPYQAFKWFVKTYGRTASPLDIFRHLDRSSPEYLDNLSTWGDLLHGRGKRIFHRSVAMAINTLKPTEVNGQLQAWEPTWKERRRYLTLARRNIRLIVDAVPYYRRNSIWLQYLKEEKLHAHDRH